MTFVSIGLGLATLFRKACNSKNCLVFKAPPMDKVDKQVFKYNDKCYTFNKSMQSCDKNKKIEGKSSVGGKRKNHHR